MCFPGREHISQGVCVSLVGEHNYTACRNMCFLGRGTHITRDMCFIGRGTHTAVSVGINICFLGRGTHTCITRDMCSRVGEYILLGMCGSWVG